VTSEVVAGSRPRIMEHLVSLTYRERLTPSLNRFVEGLLSGRIVGHRCPACGRVYVPPKGYCALCMLPTGEAEEVEVSDRGVLTGFTIVTPVAYYGQHEREPFVHASVLLDGASTPLTGVDVVGIPHGELRMGLRVEAVWRPEGERSAEGITNRGWGGLDGVIEGFAPTGEPDAPFEAYKDHIF
jgi:uncharacterized OB-fold protein